MRTIDPDSFRDDDRAVETLPIRLVIALVVGVAALAFMMNMINGLSPQTQSELSVDASETVIEGDDTSGSITFTVKTSDGEPIPKAKVLISSGTAEYDDGAPVISDSETDENGEVNIQRSDIQKDVDWKAEQDRGTLKVEVVPPGDGSKYKDKQQNQELILVQGSANTP